MPNTSSFRTQTLRRQARQELKYFLRLIYPWKEIGKWTHFPMEFDGLKKQYSAPRFRNTRQVLVGGPYEDYSHEYSELSLMLKSNSTTRKAAATICLLLGVLEKTARQEDLLLPDIQPINRLLNRKSSFLGYSPGRDKRTPDIAINVDPLRAAAQRLLIYLNIAHQCGMVHAICSRRDCGNLFMTTKGGRKYCSEPCSKKASSYEARRDYLVEWQRRERARNRTGRSRRMAAPRQRRSKG